ncbi:MAG: hypothetical protein M1460_01170 [Candidatus Thermoplasmatota archaeon]|nr:hypothetical protein [Candidatus Thermoplasmatota archaeon]
MSDEDKRTILVLPKPFFVDAFFPDRSSNTVNFVEQNNYRFIANVIIEVSANLPEYQQVAITSKNALDSLKKLLNKKKLILQSHEIETILQGTIHIVNSDSINRLNDQESMIAIADRLYESSDYDPIIVINPSSKSNYLQSYENYNRNNNGNSKNNMPFKLFDPRETKRHLEELYPNESKKIIDSMREPFNVFS